jgi:hypothetical protein
VAVAVLARAGLGNDTRLAHAAGQQYLAHAIVDLVRPRVVEIFALEPDLRPAEFFRPAAGMIDGAWAPDKMLEFIGELGQELRIVAVSVVRLSQLFDGVYQCFRDE